MDKDIKKISSKIFLPKNLDRKSWKGAERVLNEAWQEGGGNCDGFILNWDYYQKVKQRVKLELENAYSASKFAVLVPAGLFGLTQGFNYPDLDIRILGIGKHRYFLFHSAIGLYVLQHFYRQWLEKQSNSQSWSNRVLQKLSGVLLGAGAIGVGVHLLTDVFQPKSVVFPFFGSLINGTLVDDNIWLLANSLWAFKIARNIFALTVAEEYEKGRTFVKNHLQAGLAELGKMFNSSI
ncbi:MAG: hypothetical protein GX767_08560 [Firmicutes bacterium]|nr:hypothetical protein [Bacillota bacterium]